MAKQRKGKKREKEKEKDEKRERSSLRPFWSGTVSFGLVSVPVNLFPASRNSGPSFRLLSPNGTPLTRKYYCPEDNRQLDSDELVRGYEVDDQQYVVVEDEEFEALAPRKSRDIDLTRFVPRHQVPPRYFENAYYLTPAGDSNKAYRLLAEVMEENDRAGIASFVMRGKEYLVAILAENGILRAETLRFGDELREPADVGIPKAPKVPKSEVAALAKLLRKHTHEAPPEDALEDRQSARLEEIVQSKKRKGQDVVESSRAVADTDEEDESGDSQVDLLETIRRSLRAGKRKESSGNGRKGNGRAASQDRLAVLTRDELYQRAQRRNVPGRSKMTKQQLLRALRRL